jgi:hypothetical protein
VFVSLPGHRRDALAHHTAVAPAAHGFSLGRDDDDDTRVRALSYFAPPGAAVFAKVVSVGPGPDGALRVGVSLAAVDQETGVDLEPEGGGGGGGGGGRGGPPRGGRQPPRTPLGPPPEVGSIHPALVSAIQPFGVFVTLEETGYRALVPATHVAEHLDLPDRGAPDADKVAALAAVLAVGDRVRVKVCDVADPPPLEDEGRSSRPRPPRISGSIRAADQRTGADLDPGGLTWRSRGGGGQGGGQGGDGAGPPGARPAIGAGAGTTTAPGTSVVSWGHLAADVTDYGGTGRRYDLVVADADTLAAEAAAAGPPGPAAHPPESPAEGKKRKKSRHQPRVEVTSVEQALAILDKYGDRYGRRRSGKDKKKKAKKAKKRARRSRSTSTTTSSDSSSSSSGSEG